MKKHLTIPVVISAAAVAAIATTMSASASTTDVLTYGSAGGTNVSVGDTLSSGLSSGTDATFYTSTTGTSGASCSGGTMTEEVTANPAAGGTAGATAQSTTFTNCTNSEGYNETGATVSGYNVSVTDTGVRTGTLTATLTFASTKPLVRAASCNYSGSSFSGTTTFTNQELTLTSSGGLLGSACPATLYFSAVWGTTTDTSATGDPAVYVNS